MTTTLENQAAVELNARDTIEAHCPQVASLLPLLPPRTVEPLCSEIVTARNRRPEKSWRDVDEAFRAALMVGIRGRRPLRDALHAALDVLDSDEGDDPFAA